MSKEREMLELAVEAATKLAPLGANRVRLKLPDGGEFELELCGTTLDPAAAIVGKAREKGVVPDTPDNPIEDASTYGANPDDPDAKPPGYVMHDEQEPDDIGEGGS